MIVRYIFLFVILSAFPYAANAQTGTISGKLTYPSDYIPPSMIICVQDVSLYAEPTYCSNDAVSRLRQRQVAFAVNHRRASYSVTVPKGRYLIYATFPNGKAPTPDLERTRAYYDEFVRCGMSVNCTSKKRIEIRVAAGSAVRGITVGDWY